MTWRVTPSRMPSAVVGVCTWPLRTMKMLSAGAFGDVAFLIEHDRFGHAGVDGLDLGEDVVEIVQALDPRRERIGMSADHRRGDDRHPLFVHFRRIKLDGVGDNDDRGRWDICWG